ncbi:MAG: iron ABC transporter permease [bacterium]
MSSRVRYTAVLVTLTALSVLLIALGVSLGSTDISLSAVARILASLVGLGDVSDIDDITRRIVVDLRVPRVLTAFVIGSSLGLAGACLQAMFRNPMADPGVIGIGAGASFGAVLILYLGLGAVTLWAVPLGAFAGATACTLVVYTLSTRAGRTRIALLLLIGIAVNFLLGSCTAVVLHAAFSSKGHEIGRQILMWTMGGLGDRTWDHLYILLPLTTIGMTALLLNARPLDLFLLGEEQAASLGVNVQSTKLQLIVASALLTAAAVAFSGVIAFVGLVVPHMIRQLVGPGHVRLLPASALGGGVFLVAADLVARSVVAPVQLPLGVVAGLVGAPFFLFLLIRSTGRRSWL